MDTFADTFAQRCVLKNMDSLRKEVVAVGDILDKVKITLIVMLDSDNWIFTDNIIIEMEGRIAQNIKALLEDRLKGAPFGFRAVNFSETHDNRESYQIQLCL